MLDTVFENNRIVTTLENWRMLYAHNPDYADVFTDKPLATDICQRDEESFLRMQGTSQASLCNSIDDYTKPFLAVPVGAVMCGLAGFVWVLICAKEFETGCAFLTGSWATSGKSIKSTWRSPYCFSFIQICDEPMMGSFSEARQKKYELSITPNRAVALTIVVSLPRAIILALLAPVGCIFRIRTVRLNELILNSVALALVMDVDEITFTFFPGAARRMVYKTMPLRVPCTTGMWGRAEPWVRIALVVLNPMTVGFTLLSPMVKIMLSVKRVMCHGGRVFSAVRLRFGLVVAARMSKKTVCRNNYLYRAIQQRTSLGTAADNQSLLYLQGFSYTFTSRHHAIKMKTCPGSIHFRFGCSSPIRSKLRILPRSCLYRQS